MSRVNLDRFRPPNRADEIAACASCGCRFHYTALDDLGCCVTCQPEEVMQPHRIQLRRTKGWRLPPHTIVVARPSKWSNPFTLEVARKFHPGEAENLLRTRCVTAFRTYAGDIVGQIRQELAGKNLACWCSLAVPCHADVLLEIANPELKP